MLMFRPLARYADFRGRASRSEYWLFMIGQLVAYVVLVVLAFGSLGSIQNHGLGGAMMGFVGWLAAAGLLVLVLAMPNYAVLARRLHDGGFSILWMALLLPTFALQMSTFRTIGHSITQAANGGMGASGMESALESGLLGTGVIGLIAMVSSTVLFVLTLWPGTRGPNRFGPDPRDPNAVAVERPGFDEARIDDLIAQAKREAGKSDEPYKPIFDFGPGPSAQPAVAAPAPAPAPDPWTRPAHDPGVAPARTFGRRGG